jgi:hypothetical protein
MSNKQTPFNPSSFSDALTKGCYAKKAGKHENLLQEREEVIGWLRKKGKGNERAQALADKIEGCRRKHRCESLACPECADAAQRLFAKTAQTYLKGKKSVACVTILPADGSIGRSSLSKSELDRFVRRTKEKVARASVGTFIGGVDWSMNESKEKKHQPFWCQHIHGLALTDDIKAMKKKLKERFPRTKEIHRPVTVEEWDGETTALRYLLKRKFERRISFENGKRFDKKAGEQRKCRDTDHQPLRSKDKKELLLHLDNIGIAGRLFFKGVQFMNLRDTGPTLVERQSKSRTRENDKKGN